MREVAYTELTPEEWASVAEVLNACRELRNALKSGQYRDAFSEVESGQKLRKILTDLYRTIDAVPTSVFAEAL